MSKLITLCAAALAAGLVALPAGADDKELKLEGQYTVVSGERDGKAVPADELTGRTVRVTADKITASDKDGKEIWAATYTLDTSKTPAVIKMKGTGSNEGKEFTGLAERTRENQIRVVFNTDGGEVPTEFKTKEKQVLYVLKPQKRE